MSVNGYQWAWTWQADVKQAAGKVLMALADHANQEQPARPVYPSLDRMTVMTGLNRRTVITALAELEQAGIITAHRTKGGRGKAGTNHYVLHLDRFGSTATIIHKAHQKQWRETTVSGTDTAKQWRETTASSGVRPPEPEREPEKPPVQVSTERRPALSKAGGKINGTPRTNRIPERLRPVIEATVNQLVALDQGNGTRVSHVAGFAAAKQDRVSALVLELLAGVTVWPAWLAHGDHRDLTVALASKFRGEAVSNGIADRLDEAVRHAQQEPPALNNTA